MDLGAVPRGIGGDQRKGDRNVWWLTDPLLFQNLFQGQVVYRPQVAYREIRIVGSVVLN